MPLTMLYGLASNIVRENAIIDLVSNANRFHAFFLAGEGDDKFLQFTSIRFKAQEGYTRANISKTDYLASSIGIPIVSKVFVDTLGSILLNDIIFYACEVACDGMIFPFYVGKITTYAHLVNAEISDFRKLTDGRKVLKYPRYISHTAKEFFIARDSVYSHIFAVNQTLVSLIEENELNVACHLLPNKF